MQNKKSANMFQTHLKQQTHLMQDINIANMFQTYLKPKTHLMQNGNRAECKRADFDDY